MLTSICGIMVIFFVSVLSRVHLTSVRDVLYIFDINMSVISCRAVYSVLIGGASAAKDRLIVVIEIAIDICLVRANHTEHAQQRSSPWR